MFRHLPSEILLESEFVGALMILASRLVTIKSVISRQKGRMNRPKPSKRKYIDAMLTNGINNEQCDEAREELMNDQTETSTSFALVPYEYESNKKIFSIFHEDHREFKFAGQNFTISQDWNSLGVAAVVWDSALVMCEYLEKNSALIKDKKVIELGAGTGLVGMVAGYLGADVTITDRESAVSILDKNIRLNFNKSSSRNIKAEVLDWTEHKNSELKYDVILGADIIYIKETFHDLLKTLLNLGDHETLILLTAKLRYERDTEFLTLLNKFFTVKEIFYDKQKDVRLFQVNKNQ